MALATPFSAHPHAPAVRPAHQIAAAFRGDVVRPGDAGYDEARAAWNPAFDRRPALVVRPVDAADVSASIRFARDAGLELAVRSGGHSVAGHSTTEGGLLVDLGRLRGLHLDAEARTVWAGAGLTAGELTAAAHEHGLAVPFGDTGSVGIGGITLGGGVGWLGRKHGLTVDSLLAAEIVTADGEIQTVSASRRPDLFWAIRGGGGNFGVVTRFQYRLHPVGLVVGGALALPLTADVLTGLVDVAAAAPDELTTISFVMPLPPAPFVPADQHGRMALIVMPVFAGDVDAGRAAMAPFRALATPIADIVGPMPYPAMYQLTAEGSARHLNTGWSTFADGLPDAIADEIVRRMADPSAGSSMLQIRVLGGAIGRVAVDATAFAHRDRRLMFMVNIGYADPDGAADAARWVDDMAAVLRPVGNGVYANFVGDEGDARVREAYPRETYARLAAIKRRYDPTNLFRLNQNIRPG
jgi:FAD/FMN-containing dehydrogenase